MFLAGMTDKALFHGRGILEMNVLNRKKIGPNSFLFPANIR
jgi:hypothetical protein